MLRQKIESVSPHINHVAYRMSIGTQVVAEKEGTKLKIRHVGANNVILREARIKPAECPWQACNPFYLWLRISDHTNGLNLAKNMERADKVIAGAKQDFTPVSKLMFEGRYDDMKYYATACVAEKLKCGSMPKALVAAAYEGLKSAAIFAFAENDLPMLGFLNSFFVRMPKTDKLAQIEDLYPGMTTQNVCGTANLHMLKM